MLDVAEFGLPKILLVEEGCDVSGFCPKIPPDEACPTPLVFDPNSPPVLGCVPEKRFGVALDVVVPVEEEPAVLLGIENIGLGSVVEPEVAPVLLPKRLLAPVLAPKNDCDGGCPAGVVEGTAPNIGLGAPEVDGVVDPNMFCVVAVPGVPGACDAPPNAENVGFSPSVGLDANKLPPDVAPPNMFAGLFSLFPPLAFAPPKDHSCAPPPALPNIPPEGAELVVALLFAVPNKFPDDAPEDEGCPKLKAILGGGPSQSEESLHFIELSQH